MPHAAQPNAEANGGLGLRFWVLVPLVGVGAGVAAAALMTLLRAVQSLVWPDHGGNFVDAIRAASWPHRLLVLLAAGIVVTAVRWLLSLRPGGHGGELAQAIWFHAGRLPAGRTIAKALTSIVIVGMGASLGREAAPKQIGALWAWSLSHWMGLAAPQRRLLTACGAGAGIAAVYNVPLGGALFALEVLLGTVALPLIPPALVTAGVATATTWLFLSNQPTYQIAAPSVSPALLAFAVVAGPILGVASACYVRLIAWADARKPAGVAGLVAPILVFAMLGAVSGPLPELLGNGKSEVQSIFAGTLPLVPLIGLALLKPIATAACLGVGAPGGLFTPTITLGAALSGLLGRGYGWLVPGVDGNACAVIGAGALLAAATAGPISAAVLILELTGQLGGVVLPLILAIGGAMVTARWLETRSIYSCRTRQARAAAERSEAPSLSSADRYPQVLQALLRLPGDNPSLPVLDEYGATVGQVDRQRSATTSVGLAPLDVATARDLTQR